MKWGVTFCVCISILMLLKFIEAKQKIFLLKILKWIVKEEIIAFKNYRQQKKWYLKYGRLIKVLFKGWCCRSGGIYLSSARKLRTYVDTKWRQNALKVATEKKNMSQYNKLMISFNWTFKRSSYIGLLKTKNFNFLTLEYLCANCCKPDNVKESMRTRILVPNSS